MMAEREHLDSLWVDERLLWPINPQTPYPGATQNVFDPLETLTFVAAKTDKIALGTCVIDMLFHNPVILGRQFATLDVFSQGRCICGLGIGWSKDEYMASNVPFEIRGARADEFINYNKLGGIKKQQSDAAMQIYTLNQLSGNTILALFKLQSRGVTDDEILSVCRFFEEYGRGMASTNHVLYPKNIGSLWHNK
jgi:Luciferase-like monooxygenase